MTIAFIQLFAPVQVGSSATTLYTVPATPTSSLLRNGRVRFANTTGAAVTIKAWAVPNGGSEADSNVFLPTYSVPANDYVDVDVPVIAYGGKIKAIAGAATSITATALDGFIQS